MARLTSDPVFSALTRPQMMGGVTYGYAVFNLIVTLELFLLTGSFWCFDVAGVLQIIGYLGCLRDPRFFVGKEPDHHRVVVKRPGQCA